MENNPDTGQRPTAWTRLRFEAETAAADEPALSSYIHASILSHDSLAQALSYHLADTLSSSEISGLQLRGICLQAYQDTPDLIGAVERDMYAVLERDPACRGFVQPFLYLKGFLAIQSYRIAHYLWKQGRESLAFHFQSRASELFDVDIHPAARIGSGVMLDHASGIVIGETSTVGDDCSIMQGVTLGGTGKEVVNRHPKIGNGVLISVGAKVLGNITVGDEAKIAAGSVVLRDVAARTTVAGIPAKVVGKTSGEAARNMDHAIPKV